MKCPVCPDATLVMMDRQNVEIDYCPQCRGVWLDRGELDKLMDLAQRQQPAQAPAPAPAPAPDRQPTMARQDFVDSDGYGSRPAQGYQGHQNSQGYQQRRKKSWLNEIFD